MDKLYNTQEEIARKLQDFLIKISNYSDLCTQKLE